MFERAPGNNFEFEEMGDEELLNLYKKLQEDTKFSISMRNRIEESGAPKPVYTGPGKHTADSTQKGVENNFILLDKMRDEIEKRGLKTSTMEEREL